MSDLRRRLRNLDLRSPKGWLGLVLGALLSSLLSFGFEHWAFASINPSPPATVDRPGAAEAAFDTCRLVGCMTKPLLAGTIRLYRHPCRDADGREQGLIELGVFSDEYSWDFRSDTQVLLNDRPVDFLGVLRTPGIQSMVGADEVIAVGTASCEGEPTIEECRALRRARQLKAWIAQVRIRAGATGGLRALHTLNLGKYDQPCDDNHSAATVSQRKVMLIAIHRDGTLPSLESCLAEAFGSDPDLRYLTHRYSRFVLDPTPDEDPCARLDDRRHS